MARLPTPGSDDGTWGTILNDYLSVSLNSDGTFKQAGDITTALTTAQAAYVKPSGGIPESDLSGNVQSQLDNAYQMPANGIPESDLDPSVQTSINLAATSEQVSNKGVANGYASLNSSGQVPTGQLASGTASTSVYLRGDGTWQTPPSSGGSTTLGGDTDVSITSPANGQVLTYDSTSSLWKNQALPSGGGSSNTFTAVSVSANYTASNYAFVLVNASSGGITITLPAASNGAWVRVKKLDSTTNAVLAVGQSGSTIDGQPSSISINSQYQSQDFMSDGTNWYQI